MCIYYTTWPSYVLHFICFASLITCCLTCVITDLDLWCMSSHALCMCGIKEGMDVMLGVLFTSHWCGLSARSSCFFTSPLELSNPCCDGEVENQRYKTCIYFTPRCSESELFVLFRQLGSTVNQCLHRIWHMWHHLMLMSSGNTSMVNWWKYILWFVWVDAATGLKLWKQDGKRSEYYCHSCINSWQRGCTSAHWFIPHTEECHGQTSLVVQWHWRNCNWCEQTQTRLHLVEVMPIAVMPIGQVCHLQGIASQKASGEAWNGLHVRTWLTPVYIVFSSFISSSRLNFFLYYKRNFPIPPFLSPYWVVLISCLPSLSICSNDWSEIFHQNHIV